MTASDRTRLLIVSDPALFSIDGVATPNASRPTPPSQTGTPSSHWAKVRSCALEPSDLEREIKNFRFGSNRYVRSRASKPVWPVVSAGEQRASQLGGKRAYGVALTQINARGALEMLRMFKRRPRLSRGDDVTTAGGSGRCQRSAVSQSV
jgi:hypothetical protein